MPGNKVRMAWLVLGVVGGLTFEPGCADPARPRSIVLIVVDTLRADHLGVYGYERPTSPALDRHAERAARFDHALAASPWTLPSMATLLTGLPPARHRAGVRLSRGFQPEFARLDPGVATLAEHLRARGYATAAIVNNPFLAPNFGLARGFELYDHAPASNTQLRRAPAVLGLALHWIREQRKRRFLLLVHLFDPHASYDPPPDDRGRFTRGYAGSLEFPVAVDGALRLGLQPTDAADRRFITGAYDEELAGVDRELGKFFAAIEETGLAKEVLIVLTSDHGEELFDHGGFEHGHSVYQELLHVPLLVWGPGVSAGVHTTPVAHEDLLPTLLDALGEAPLPGLDGRSFWPLLSGGPAPPDRELLAENTLHGPERRALLRWPWKLVEGPDGLRLYDLSRDPGEQRDLAAAEVERTQSMLSAMRNRSGGIGPTGTEETAPLEQGVRDQLESLGYIE